MTTLSQLVDDLLVELVRPDMRSMLVDYANQTVREMHFRPATNAPVLFDANRYEEQIAVTSSNPFLWPIPSVTRFQDIEIAFCPEAGVVIQRKNPRVINRESMNPDSDWYYYISGVQVAFSGPAVGDSIKLAYYMYPARLKYKTAAERSIVFDVDSDTYTLVGGGIPTDEQLALETHWMLQRWPDTIKEGVRAKAYKRMGDDSRTRMFYSAFEAARTAVWQSEPSS